LDSIYKKSVIRQEDNCRSYIKKGIAELIKTEYVRLTRKINIKHTEQEVCGEENLPE
jgi:hypothetical protein